MRVLFVFPDQSSTVTHYTGTLSYGIGVLSAVLRRAGHETALYHLKHEPTEDEFREAVRAERPDLVAFSSISHYARRLGRWTTWAHEASGAPVVVGGVHATFSTEDVASLPNVDYTCVGEGDATLLELCEALEHGRDPGDIAGLWVRQVDGVRRNPMRPLVDDLDALPDPDLSLFDVPDLYNSRLGTFSYVMSRGCAFRCTYCSAHTLRRMAPRTGKFWRFLSPSRAVEQLRGLLDRNLPNATQVSFSDAIVFPTRDWLEEFVPLYRDRIGIPVSCNMRADMVDEDSARLLREMGTEVVRLGVESGNAHMTRDVMKRHLDVDDLRRAFRLLREQGIRRWSYNIVGLPTETLPMALETVKFNAEIDPEQAIPFIFYPYPGTELHRLADELGYLTGREYDTYKVGVTLRQPQFTEDDVMFVHRFFHPLRRLYAAALRLPRVLRSPARVALDAALVSPLLPRGAMVRVLGRYRGLRHSLGEWLVARSPSIYRGMGGTAPAAVVGRVALDTAGPRSNG